MRKYIGILTLFFVSCVATSQPKLVKMSLAEMGFTTSPVYYDQILWRASELHLHKCSPKVVYELNDSQNLFIFMEPQTIKGKNMLRILVVRNQDGKRFIGSSYVSDGWNKETVWVFRQ